MKNLLLLERELLKNRKGGPWALAWGASEHGYHYVVSGIIKSLLPGKRLRIDSLVYFSPDFPVLGPMRLFVNVREKDGRTRVSVRQDGYGQGPDWDRYYQAVVKGWKEALRNLKAFLES